MQKKMGAIMYQDEFKRHYRREGDSFKYLSTQDQSGSLQFDHQRKML